MGTVEDIKWEKARYIRGMKKGEFTRDRVQLKKKRTQETEKRKFPCSEKGADLHVSSFQCIPGIIAPLRSPVSLR